MINERIINDQLADQFSFKGSQYQFIKGDVLAELCEWHNTEGDFSANRKSLISSLKPSTA
jgi:hypothetical protein